MYIPYVKIKKNMDHVLQWTSRFKIEKKLKYFIDVIKLFYFYNMM